MKHRSVSTAEEFAYNRHKLIDTPYIIGLRKGLCLQYSTPSSGLEQHSNARTFS